MQQFQCDVPKMTCKTQSESQDSTGERVAFEQPWRSHSTAICTDGIAQHNKFTSSNAQSVSTHAKHNSTASKKKRRSHPEPSVPLRVQFEIDFTAKRRRLTPSLKRANFSPQRNLHSTEKTQCFVQILTFKSHPWCNSSNAICQKWLAKHNQNRKTPIGEPIPFEQPWRSAKWTQWSLGSWEWAFMIS